MQASDAEVVVLLNLLRFFALISSMLAGDLNKLSVLYFIT